MLLRAEPGKQRPRSCRTQELARSRGPRKRVAEKGWLTRLDESQYDGRTTSTCERKKNGRECTRAGAARWKNCTEAREGKYRIVGTGQSGERRVPENGQRGSKSVIAAPWKWPMMAWSTVCDDYFRWPTNQELAPRWQGLHLCKL